MELFWSIAETGIPAMTRFEFVVGSGTLEFDDMEVRDLFEWLLDHARG